MTARLSWRSDSAAGRPTDIPLPGHDAPAMPARRGGRPLKRWRYVGVFSPSLMLCAARVQIGPARQSFWAVWDGEQLCERTHTLARRGSVALAAGELRVRDGELDIELALDEDDGVETVCSHGRQYVWTRKQAGVGARGRLRIGERTRTIDARAVIDDTAGYHARRTTWLWCAGVGGAADGLKLAWNLVVGVNDPPRGSERSVWVDGVAREVGPVAITAELDRVSFGDGAELHFEAVATRRRHDNLLILRSDYQAPFGVFSGTLPDGIELVEGYGVMERHDARW